MQTVTSGKVQASFGEIADLAKMGEPVTITHHGRPSLLLIRYKDGMDALQAAAALKMGGWLENRAAAAPAAANEVSLEDLNKLIDAERAERTE